MKKIYTLLPVLFLTACVQTGEEYQQDDFYYEDTYHDESAYLSQEEYAFEDDSLMIDEYTGLVVDETPAVIENSQQNMQPVIQPSPVVAETKEATITVSEDGTKIIIPAQEIYIGNENAVVSADVQTRPIMAYSSPDILPAENTSNQPKKQVWITLQNKEHPNTFVQCALEDADCVTSHEQQGYIRVRGLPHFAGYQDILGSSDYPGEGQWRNNNNIPRW